MAISKSNLLILLLAPLFISSCQTTGVFELKTFPSSKSGRSNDLHIISVSSTRVQQKCVFLDASAENNWRHQYLMYVLDGKNEVLEIINAVNLDREACYSQLHNIEKILRSEPKVKVCARDELNRMVPTPPTDSKSIQFETLGRHPISYESLTFDSICNSKKCVTKNEMWVDTCPGFIKN